MLLKTDRCYHYLDALRRYSTNMFFDDIAVYIPDERSTPLRSLHVNFTNRGFYPFITAIFIIFYLWKNNKIMIGTGRSFHIFHTESNNFYCSPNF